ncbi:MAG: lipid-A-disaccharide synthase [Gammaproteobacteria bacterium]
MIRVGMVAGETSGDLLGAGLINELTRLTGKVIVEGIGGEKLVEAGMIPLYPMDMLSVMGITEVMGRYRELKKAQADIRDHFLNDPPDVFIGVDAPDFNLALERDLRQSGVPTVHYVSPSVWAWREYRVKKIKQAVDLMLTLFPFENSIYDKHDIPNTYVGHPLADRLMNPPAQASARAELNIPTDRRVIAVLPGSRMNEINNIGPVFLSAAVLLNQKNPDLYFTSGLASERTRHRFMDIHAATSNVPDMDMHLGKTHKVMLAADYIMIASGTATLEAMLLNRPMVVAYRLSLLTYFIVKSLAKIPYASLPNILANEGFVPECLQQDCHAEKVATEMQALLDNTVKTETMKQRFAELSDQLAVNANRRAAEAVFKLVNRVKHA